VPANKTPAKNTKAKKAIVVKKAAAKKATRKTPAKASGRSATPVRRTSGSAMPARPGDLIVIDSPQVGSPAREGEIVKVIHGELSVSYWVMWGDGHQTLISPAGGTARIVRT
jgi:hypothetical protein